MVHAVGDRQGRWADAWAGVRGRQRRVPTEHTRGDALPQNQTPLADVAAMMAALPDAHRRSRRPRKVLVLGRASGFVHSSIPLAARTIEEIGKKTAAWTTTITYDAGRHQRRQPETVRRHLPRQHDRRVPRRFDRCGGDCGAPKALLDFVRGGKDSPASMRRPTAIHRARSAGRWWRRSDQLRHRPGGHADDDGRQEQRRAADERGVHGFRGCGLAKLDPDKSGRDRAGGFPQRFAAIAPPRQRNGQGHAAGAATTSVPTEIGTWPEFNTDDRGVFKFHWNDGQSITVKIDEPKTRSTPLQGQGIYDRDETYTFGRTSTRSTLHVLTSIDYAAMSAGTKPRRRYPRRTATTR